MHNPRDLWTFSLSFDGEAIRGSFSLRTAQDVDRLITALTGERLLLQKMAEADVATVAHTAHSASPFPPNMEEMIREAAAKP